VTPHYVLSSLVIPEEEAWVIPSAKRKGRQGPAAFRCAVPWRVGFRDPRAQVATKRLDDFDTYTGEPKGLYTCVDPADARALFQHRNVLFYKGIADTYMDLKPDVPVNGYGIDHEETDGQYRFFRESGGDGEAVYVGALERNGVGVLEVGLAGEHKSWVAFKSVFRANAATLESARHIEYVACDGTRIAYSGADSVTVNGEPHPMRDWPLYDSPLMKADWANQSDEAGVIRIGNRQTGRLVLDYRDSGKPRRWER
jgi:hypothetical protein